MEGMWLLERMAQWGEGEAFVSEAGLWTYARLLEAVSEWRRTLTARQLGQGRIVALEGDDARQVCAVLLALLAQRHVVVPLTPAAEARRRQRHRTAQVEWVVRCARSLRWRIQAGPVQRVDHPLLRRLLSEERPGLVFFSSGSSGAEKAVLHDAQRFLAKFLRPRRALRTLSFLALDHIGGLNTLFHTLANGGTVVVPPDRSPAGVCRAIQRHRVELLPTSPSFLNLLLVSEAYRCTDLSSLRLITYGTEPMPEATLRRVHALFPGVALQQTYGLSELGVLRSKSPDSRSLWVKVGGEGFETKVVEATLRIRAASAMVGYLNAPSPFDAEGWLNTGDLVETRGEYVRFLGRASELINVGGEKVYPPEVESALLQIENVREATVHGERNPLLGQVVTATVTLARREPLAAVRERIHAHCRAHLAPHQRPVRIQVVSRQQMGPRFKKVSMRAAMAEAETP